MLDPSAYTLAPNGQGGRGGKSPLGQSDSSSGSGRVYIHDPRWRFQDENMLPKPREFLGLEKKYRAGRGSSVPLDLSSFE